MGFDGIIDRTVDTKFGSLGRTGKKMEGVDADTVHVIVFDPDKLNTAINKAVFSADDITQVKRDGETVFNKIGN